MRILVALLLTASGLCFSSVVANGQTATRTSVLDGPWNAKGDCKTDDTNAFQSAINSSKSVWVPNPPGGCYLVKRRHH